MKPSTVSQWQRRCCDTAETAAVDVVADAVAGCTGDWLMPSSWIAFAGAALDVVEASTL